MEQTLEAKKQILERVFDLADIGRKYAPEFISGLSIDIHSALYDWLKNNSAPTEILHALEHDNMLKGYSGALNRGELSDMDAHELVLVVPEITELVMKLGGTLYCEAGESARRENVLTWQNKK